MAVTDLLAGLNQNQRDCVEHVGGPLLVSAGAGSGKTFMLTRRIAYALQHPELSGVREIDQDVLAITFTELAAAEIKGRVRAALRSMGTVDGIDMVAQALKVDAAWISTIHGMCSRILHEHALELGLDPQFRIIDDTDRQNLLVDSINEALGNNGVAADADPVVMDELGDASEPAADGLDPDRLSLLFARFAPDKIRDMVRDVVETAAGVYGGLDSITFGPDVREPRDIASDVHASLEDIRRSVHANLISATGKQSSPAFVQKVLGQVNDETIGAVAFEGLAASKTAGYDDVARALAAFNPRFGRTPNACAEDVIAFRLTYDEACIECALGMARAPLGALLGLVRATQLIFDRKKAELCVLDQNDLLSLTLRALETDERISREYCDKFKLVMVDEFQDTSALQIAIISKLDGTNDSRLCTVGDTQQSIYRFRGADVDTYREHKRHMREDVGARYRELGVNYRSHGDIITFVNRIFSQDQVFGSGPSSEFIQLGFNERRPTDFSADVPRIDVVLVSDEHGSHVGTEGKVAVEAKIVCDRFLALHDSGSPSCSWGDMVILLGRMTNAGVFADELRAHGIPCVISGGSIFGQTSEAATVLALANSIANPHDDASVASLLVGEMFGLSYDEVLAVATKKPGRRRGLWAGLNAMADCGTPRIELASAVLRHAVANSRKAAPSDVLLAAVLESGWLDRLQALGVEGMASAANVLKAIRIAQAQESDGVFSRSMAGVAYRLRAKIVPGMKEGPGALNASGQDAVRIMTIHASKGLEFPIVALAECYGVNTPRTELRLESIGSTLHMALSPKSCLTEEFKNLGTCIDDYSDQYEKACEHDGFEPDAADPAQASTAARYWRAVSDHAKQGELAEARRKFYVGATRPREALIIAAGARKNKTKIESGEGYYAEDLVDDIRSGLVGALDLVDSPEGVDFGGSRRARCHNIRLDGDEEGGIYVVGGALEDYYVSGRMDAEPADAQNDEKTVAVPEPVDLLGLLPFNLPCNPLRANTFSYTSIAHPQVDSLDDADGTEAGNGSDTGADAEKGAAREKAQGQIAGASITETDPDELEGGSGTTGGSRAESELGDGGIVDLSSDGGDAFAPARDEERIDPTSFGSSFHTAAQWIAEAAIAAKALSTRAGTEPGAHPVPDPPGRDRLEQIARTWGLDTKALGRLESGLERWVRSDVAREAFARRRLEPEAPFYVTLLGPQGEPLHLEGSIDLLCTDAVEPCSQRALVVDYKTGGSASETADDLQEKHLLQAQCYAYAVLLQGYAGVDLRFVRVEIHDEDCPDQPQVVRYSFDAGDVERLAETIRDAYRKAQVSR